VSPAGLNEEGAPARGFGGKTVKTAARKKSNKTRVFRIKATALNSYIFFTFSVEKLKKASLSKYGRRFVNGG